ncbi:polymorphic toxin type 30 domain-containing protein [Streptomyces sp. URMC 129]|uniref:polymorphic toxin type 30 domain-containing protein n=1 Tax=Streptomyces sp. URMC 129 TaxID=3423407 RepID=UPI003F1C6D58
MDSDPTPGSPDEVRELAEELQTFADDVGEALGKIRGMASDRAVLDWSGLSADAFRAEFDGVPENLAKLQTSYDMAADALARYWPRLQNAQGMADRALERAVAAQADLSSAQASLSDAEDWVSRAGDEAERLEREGDAPEPPDEEEVRQAVRDRQAADAAAGAARSRVDDAEQRLSAARELAEQAREMREEAARECASGIDDASDAGIQNRKWWEKAFKWVRDNWDTIVEVCKVIVAVLGVVVMIIGGPLAWVVLAAALVVLADTLVKYARGQATLLDVAFAALDCIPGMKGLTTLGGLARGMRSLATTGMRGLRQGALRLGRQTRRQATEMDGRNLCGDPVDMATGELVMSATDVELPGVLPLILERHHISTYRYGRWFGTSWASTLDQRLLLDEYGARLFTADGMTLLYPRPIPGEQVMPVEGPRWGLSWDGQPGSPLTVHQRHTGRTLHFSAVPGRPGSELALTAITDRNTNRIRFQYDETGAPTDAIHDGGYHVGITTTGGRVTALRLLNDPAEPVLLRYGYDDAGLLSEVYNSSGLPLKFFYDDHFRLARWEDRNGYWYSYDYDAEGRCVYTTGTDRVLEYRYAYDTENNRTTAVNSLGHATVYQFNDSYQLIAETDPLGNTTHRAWDRYDRALTITDPLGRTTRYEYDGHGNPTVVVRPDGHQIRTEYNELGLPTEVIQPDGSVWRQTYDGAGNRTVLMDPAGNRTRYSYDEHGGLVSITDPLGRVTLIESDAAGLPVAITDVTGERTVVGRDPFGRVVRVTDPLGAVRHMERTVEGRPLRHTDALGGVQTWFWDPEGNLLAHTDETGSVTHFEYGAFDLPTVRIEADGARYEFRRDTELRVTEVLNAQEAAWTYEYDAAGRLISETDFDGRSLTYELDAAGRLLSRTNALGQKVTYIRDVLGNISEKRTADQSTQYTYDLAGRLLGASSPEAEVVIDRDRVGRVVAETVNGRTVRTTYNVLGRPLTRTTPSGHTSTWTYDDAGYATALVTGGHTLTFEHDAIGREIRRRIGTDVVITHAWDAAGRPAGQHLAHGVRNLRSRSYTYRADHHLTAVRDQDSVTTSFDIDPVGRIIGVSGPEWTETYAYDAAGNQTSAFWVGAEDSDAVGERFCEGTRITRAGRMRYEFDRAGRTVLRQKSRLSKKPDTWRYRWDAEDRLTQVTTPDGTHWTYQYDPLGRRIAKARLDDRGSVVEQVVFTWSGTTLIEQATVVSAGEQPSLTLTWDYSGLRPLTQVERASQSEYDRRFYAIVTDLVGAPTELVDEDGDIVWSRSNATTVWGSGTANSDGTADTPLRFPGQYIDPETGWHYNVHRHYDPHIARYTTPDPLGLDPAPNQYSYVSNPHTWADPLGLAAHPGVDSPAGPGPWDMRGRDPMEVVPDNAQIRELTPHPNGGSQYGLEFKWVDSQGRTVRLRAHGPDGTAPAGSNSATGETYRIQFGQRYQDEVGNLYPSGVHNPASPNYNPSAANDTHIPWPSAFPGL